MTFREYKAHLRKRADELEWQPEGWNMPEVQNPQDPYLEARHGPWRGVWNGGRLMDIYHDESDSPVHCMNAGEGFDWQTSRYPTPPTQQGMTQRLRDWSGEDGDTYTREVVPYQ